MELCRRAILAFITLCAFPVMALSDYVADYDIMVRGIDAGSMRYEAVFTDTTYRIDTFSEPSLLAAGLGYGKIRETVVGLLADGYVQPQDYQRTIKGKPEDNLHYVFNPEANQIHITKGKKTNTFSYVTGERPLDVLSMITQSILNIENHFSSENYPLITEDKIRSYHVQPEEIKVLRDEKGREVNARVYRQVNGNRETLVYFADNPLRLVFLEQLRKGKSRFSITLTDYKILK